MRGVRYGHGKAAGRYALPLSMVAAVLALGLIAWFLWTRPSVTHTVVEAPADPAPVPASVSSVGWTWETGSGYVSEVLVGTHGPLVVFGDGVMALDGATGDELWTYRTPHGDVVDAGSIEGGRFVHLEHGPMQERTVTVFDTATGAVVAEGDTPDSHLAWTLSQNPDAPEEFLLHRWDPAKAVTYPPDQAASWVETAPLGGDDRLWAIEPPEPAEPESSCYLPGDLLARDGHLLVLQVCAADRALNPLGASWQGTEPVKVELLAFGNTRGEELWAREWTFDVGAGEYSLLDLGVGEHGLPGFGRGDQEVSPAVVAYTGPYVGWSLGRRIVVLESGEEPVGTSEEPFLGTRVVHADSEALVHVGREGAVHELHRDFIAGESVVTTVEEFAWVINACVALTEQYLVLDGNRLNGGASVFAVPAEKGNQEGELLLDEENTPWAMLAVPGSVVVALPDRVVGLT